MKNKRPSWKRSAISAAVAMAAASYAPVIMAASTTISTAVTTNSTLTLTGTDSLTVTNTGALHATSGYTAAFVDSSATGVHITNSGTIAADGRSAIYDGEATSNTVITNNAGALISAKSNYSALYFSGDLGGSIANNGTIKSVGDSYAAGVYVSGNLTGAITNSSTGVISAKSHATGTNTSLYAYGIAVNGDVSLGGSITNAGKIEAIGTGSYAYVYGILVGGDLNGTVSNSGTINVTGNATADGSDVYAYGIYVGGDMNGSLTNSGAINVTAQSLTSDGYNATGIYVGGSVTAGHTLLNSGTITVTDVANSYASSAIGIYVGGDVAGTMTNSGTINLTATSTSSGYAYAVGMYVDGDVSGTVTNSGHITAVANAFSATDAAFGIRVEGDVTTTGSVINSGTIAVTANNVSSYAYAYGIYVGGDMNGTLTNSGSITASATVTRHSSAYAYGIYVNGAMGDGAHLTNSGTITATAQAKTNSAYAYGIYVGGDLGIGASIVSSGSITATATTLKDTEAFAYGIYVGNLGQNASITNNGTINVTATADSSYASAYGIYAGSLGQGAHITNSGTINVAAHAVGTSYATAYGIYAGNLGQDASITNSGTVKVAVSGGTYPYFVAGIYAGSLDVNAKIINSGTITATATLTNTSHWYGYAYGMYVGSLDTGASISNSGIITATVVTGSEALAYGIEVGSLNTGATVSNSGTINVTATGVSSDGSAYAYGIYENSNLTGASITNSGTITATANGVTWASAYGMYVSGTVDATSTITNSGTITAKATATANGSGSAYGIYVNTLNGNIVNSGTITATAPSATRAYSIYASSGTGGTVTNSGTLNGSLYLGGNINLVNTGTVDIPVGVPGAGGFGYVGGNYTQGVGGVLSLGATSAVSYTNFNVVGTADFTAGNTLKVKVATANTLANGDVLAGVITTGGITAPSGFVVQDNSLGFNFTAALNGNNVDLTAASTGLTTISAALGGAGGSLGSVLDTLLAQGASDPGISAALDEIGSQTTAGGVANAVNQLKPLMSGQLSNATLGALGATNNAVQQRQDVGFGLSSGDLYMGNNKAWFKPFGSWADQDNDGGVTGYKARSYGAVAGADGDFAPGARIGFAFSYAHTKVDSNGGGNQTAKIDSYQFVAYGNKTIDERTQADFQADIGMHNTDGKRHVVGLTASSSYDSLSYHVGASIGRSYPMADNAIVVASLGADYTLLDTDGYTEKGAGGLNLRVGSDSTDQLILSLKGKYSKPLNGTTTLVANAGIGYDALSEQNSITASFAGLPTASFTTKGIDPSPWTLQGGVGVVMKQGAATQITVHYDIEGRDKFINQTASVKARWAF